jgi:HTH-type transcriptional regulator/antitoxin HigA
MHELAHIALHYNDGISVFYDEIEGVKIPNLDKKEKEADELAGEVLVPSNRWEVSPARIIPSFMAAKSLAQELGVHIAVVAGKIRHEGGKYIYLNKIINETDVKKLFSNEK